MGEFVKPPDPSWFCERMDDWAGTAIIQKGNLTPNFEQAWQTVRLAIRKSCLLDRMFYGGERPSQTPCPVHKGQWAGVHFGGVTCGCDKHRCGCTTGWLPDEHCGCAPSENG